MSFFFTAAPLAVAAEAVAAVCETTGAVVCPKPRHTLASTAALFLPDKSSPILLAPSETEIQNDPHYYIFGAQLVTALVLFSLAYSLAHIILGSVRRRERKAKQQWKEERKQQRAKELQGRIPTLHPTLYHVAPALPLTPTPFSLDLSEPAISTSVLSRAKRRVRHCIDWMMYLPVRIRRRFRVDKSAKQAKQQVAQARRFATSPSLEPSKPTFRQRISKLTNLTAFISRAKQASAADSPRSSTSDSVVDDTLTLNLILGSFTSMLPPILPWTIREDDEASLAAAAAAAAPKPNRRGSITDRLSEWTAALSVNMAAMQASPPPTYTPLDRGMSSRLLSPPALPPVVEEIPRSLSPPPRADASSPPPSSSAEYFSSPYLLSHSSHADSFPSVENEREFLTYSLATFVLAVGLVWLELLVLSVLASTSLHGVSLNQTYAFSWCTHSLVRILWLGTVWMSSISLFVLAPFGFLYYEAEGLGGRKGFVSRVAETLLVLSAFTVLLYGSFHLLQSLLDRGGLLHPFTYTHSEASAAAQMNVPLEEFSIYDLFESSFGVGTAWNLFYAHLSTLYSNVWHFLPGLIMLLVTCHHGFIALISDAYSIGVPLDAFSPSSSSALLGQLNTIKLELSTAERKWIERETEARRREQGRPRKVQSSNRAIAPSQQSRLYLTADVRRRAVSEDQFLGLPPTAEQKRLLDSTAASDRKDLLELIHRLRAQHEQVTREMQPTTWSVRLRSSPYVRNTIWFSLTVIAILLTWHIILRVAQREARLIFRGSIFRWFRSAADDPYQMTTVEVEQEAGLLAAVVRGVWSTLHQLKSLLGFSLSMLTGRDLTKPSTIASSTALASNISSPAAHSMPPAPMFDSPLLNGLFEFFRLLASVLLGINGFHHPLVAFFVDISCVGFFLFASAHRIYSSRALAKFSPVHYYRAGIERGSSTNAMLLFSPQFFTVNSVIFLLLTSSLPLATWMLGLSSFDLMEFYPQSSVQFATSGSGAANTVPLFVHLYNLSFLFLTGWHISVLSKNLIVWVVVDQIVARIEVIVERGRVALGWAEKNARPEDRFKLFGSWRKAMAGAMRRSKWETIKHVLRATAGILARICTPLLRYTWIVLRQIALVLFVIGAWSWVHISAFVRGELEDDADENAAAAVSPSPPRESHAGATAPVVPPASVLGRSDSSFTTQLLAEIDAATTIPSGPDEKKSLDSSTIVLPGPLLSPSRRQGSLSFFSRSISAPARIPDADDSSTSSMHDDSASASLDVDPLLGQTPSDYSPLYRSATTWTSRAMRRSRDFFMTPGLVPETSRKLPTEETANVSTPLSEGGSEVTEADFPTFPTSPIQTIDEEKDYSGPFDPMTDSPAFPASPIQTIDEEKDDSGASGMQFDSLSTTSSTAATPQLSPYSGLTPTQHRMALSALENAALSLAGDADVQEDDSSREETPLALKHRLSGVEATLGSTHIRELSLSSGGSDSSRDSDQSARSPPISPASAMKLPASAKSSGRHASTRTHRAVSQSTSSGSDSE